MSRYALAELGLDRDADEAAVKRAYAARLKTRRPDDDPTAFQRLHETFQVALAYVRHRAAHRTPANAAPGEAAHDAGSGATPAAPPPLRPPPTEDGRPVRPPWTSQPPSTWRHDFPKAPPGPVPQHEPPFDRSAFASEFAGVLADLQADLPGWLQAHPALYSLARRDQLVPVLVHLLETAEQLPTPAALDALFAFFGLDLIDRRNLPLQPRLAALTQKARYQHREIVGPDLSFMIKPDGAPPPRPAQSVPWVIPLILILFTLVNMARCASNSFKPVELPAEERSRVLERTPGAPLGAPNEPPVWRYNPPEPAPESPSSPDPDKG